MKRMILTGALLAASAAFALPSTGAESSAVPGLRPFPTPTCPVNQASLKLRDYYQQNPVPTGDGITPWSLMPGVWLNEKSGIYIRITTKKVESARYGIVQVTIRDLCKNDVLAQGSRVILEEDFLDTETLKITLKDYLRDEAKMTSVFSFDSRPGMLQIDVYRPDTATRPTVLLLERVAFEEGSRTR